MIDILYNKLRATDDASVAEWKDVDPEIFKKHSQHSLHNVKEPIKEIINELPKITEELLTPSHQPQQIHQQPPILVKNKRKGTQDTKGEKDATNKPLNIIINETTSFNNSTEYIKEALITMISKEEFTKVFGQTKCAEIMSGIVNNRWNKSTALFISFLLDKEVYYNDNIVIYNKEKNKGRIVITKT